MPLGCEVLALPREGAVRPCGDEQLARVRVRVGGLGLGLGLELGLELG